MTAYSNSFAQAVLRQAQPTRSTDLVSPSIREQPILERYSPYFEEARKKAISVVVVFCLVAAVGFVYYRQILTRIMHIFRLQGINVVLTSPYQFIDLAVYTGIIAGLIAAFPLLLYHFLRFIKPALHPKEYTTIMKILPFSIGLFLAGFAFGVWVVQFVITIFSQTTSQFAVENIWDIGHFFAQVLITGISLAFVFQVPVIMTIALRLKIVAHRQIAAQRKYIYIAILIFSALLPPTDLLSLSLLAIIPLFLFEIALWLNKPQKVVVRGG